LDIEHLKIAEHLDHSNAHTFEIDDLKKLIAKVECFLIRRFVENMWHEEFLYNTLFNYLHIIVLKHYRPRKTWLKLINEDDNNLRNMRCRRNSRKNKRWRVIPVTVYDGFQESFYQVNIVTILTTLTLYWIKKWSRSQFKQFFFRSHINSSQISYKLI